MNGRVDNSQARWNHISHFTYNAAIILPFALSCSSEKYSHASISHHSRENPVWLRAKAWSYWLINQMRAGTFILTEFTHEMRECFLCSLAIEHFNDMPNKTSKKFIKSAFWMGNTCQVAVSSFLVCAEDLRGGTWHQGSIQYPRVSIRLGKKWLLTHWQTRMHPSWTRCIDLSSYHQHKWRICPGH